MIFLLHLLTFFVNWHNKWKIEWNGNVWKLLIITVESKDKPELDVFRLLPAAQIGSSIQPWEDISSCTNQIFSAFQVPQTSCMLRACKQLFSVKHNCWWCRHLSNSRNFMHYNILRVFADFCRKTLNDKIKINSFQNLELVGCKSGLSFSIGGLGYKFLQCEPNPVFNFWLNWFFLHFFISLIFYY